MKVTPKATPEKQQLKQLRQGVAEAYTIAELWLVNASLREAMPAIIKEAQDAVFAAMVKGGSAARIIGTRDMPDEPTDAKPVNASEDVEKET